MSDDLQVGDVIVRVAGDNHPMPRGAYDRIVAIEACRFDDEDEICDGLVLFTFWRPFGEGTCWCPDNFRKLPPASDEFTRRLRACRPHNVGEPA